MAIQPGDVPNHAERMTQIVATFSPQLRASGFRKRRHVFNRRCDDVVHVVDVQAGPSWSAVRGCFAVDVAVFVPEVARIRWDAMSAPAFVNAASWTTLRVDVSDLAGFADRWWPVDSDAVAHQVRDIVLDDCVRWLEQRRTREQILALEAGGELLSPIDEAIIRVALQDVGTATDVLGTYLAAQEPPHADHVREIAGLLGLRLPE